MQYAKQHPGILAGATISPLNEPASFLFASAQRTFDACLETMRKKNSDYAKPENEFANFEASLRIGVPVQTAILIRMQDKMTRIENLLFHTPAVADESMDDSLDDLINYATILKARRQFEQQHP